VLALVLLLAYWRHASRTDRPVLRLDLLRTRTFRVAVTGSFVTRLGAGGMPFLLPLLYQVGLGYTPVQSGLLIMPQFLAAISLKFTIPMVLTRLGYRGVLLTNTLLMGVVIVLFATIDAATPVWLIALQAVAFGYVSSLQYTSMNTLVYADLDERDTSMGSSIASTLQQMSISFGVAVASLAVAVFVPDRFRATPLEMISGLHQAFVVLGLLTIASTLVLRELRAADGVNVSRHLPVTSDSLAVAGASSHDSVSPEVRAGATPATPP
jgi:Major Facilitator Superfamily